MYKLYICTSHVDNERSCLIVTRLPVVLHDWTSRGSTVTCDFTLLSRPQCFLSQLCWINHLRADDLCRFFVFCSAMGGLVVRMFASVLMLWVRILAFLCGISIFFPCLRGLCPGTVKKKRNVKQSLHQDELRSILRQKQKGTLIYLCRQLVTGSWCNAIHHREEADLSTALFETITPRTLPQHPELNGLVFPAQTHPCTFLVT